MYGVIKTTGKAFCFGDNVDTDQILPGYAMSYPPERLGTAALKGSEIPDFAEQVQAGDLIVAGDNFGCGSSREQAPVALKACGVGMIVAKSFARIFRKNAVNIGLTVITCSCVDEIKAQAQAGDVFRADAAAAELINETRGIRYALTPLARASLETLEAGGLINKVRTKLRARGETIDA